MTVNKVIVVCAFLTAFVGAAKIPDYIHICKRNDPEVAKCIREAIGVIRPYLKSGIPELQVPPLEPFHINRIEIFRGQDGNNFRASLKNIDVYGASDFQIKRLKVDVPQKTISAAVKIPVLTLVGDYDVNARLLVVPLKGEGKVHGNATNISGKAVIKYTVEEGEGGNLIKFDQITLKLSVEDYNVHLDNLFQGDPNLSQAANAVLNDNKEELIKRAMPFIEQKVSEILLESANKIVKGINYDEIFPEK